MSRVDDIINVAGHRLSTGAMEEVLAGHPDVAECAVVGVADEIKGEVPVGFVVTKAGVERSDADITRELVERVREQIGPVAAFKTALVGLYKMSGVEVVKENGRYWIITPNGPLWSNIDERGVDPALNYLFEKRRQERQLRQ